MFVNIVPQISFKKISLSSGLSHKMNLKIEIKGHIAITSKTKSSPGLGCVNAILRFCLKMYLLYCHKISYGVKAFVAEFCCVKNGPTDTLTKYYISDISCTWSLKVRVDHWTLPSAASYLRSVVNGQVSKECSPFVVLQVRVSLG